MLVNYDYSSEEDKPALNTKKLTQETKNVPKIDKKSQKIEQKLAKVQTKSKLPDIQNLLEQIPINSNFQHNDEIDIVANSIFETYQNVPPPNFNLSQEGDNMIKIAQNQNQSKLVKRKNYGDDIVSQTEFKQIDKLQKNDQINFSRNSQKLDNQYKITFKPPQVGTGRHNVRTIE